MLSQLTTHFLFLLPTLALPNPHQITTYPRDTAASTITQFRYSGSGCTQNSNSVTYSPAATWSTPQTYTFKQFAAAVADTENCELHFQGAGLPAGWQVSVASVEFTGKLNLKDDAAAVQWFWQGYWSDDAADTRTLAGSIDGPPGAYTINTNVTTPLWSECIGADGNPGILNVNLRVAVNGGAGTFEVDSETLRYRFRKCQ